MKLQGIKKYAAAVIATALALGLAGCGAPAPSGGDDDGVLVWGKEADPAGINPLTAGDVHSWEIFSLVYEPFTRPNDDLTPGPGVAESWEQLDETTWRFTLREGVTFSNGRPLSAEDIAGTWEAYKEAGVRTSQFPNLDRFEVVDDRTVDAMLTAPVPDLPNRLEILWVLPAAELADGSYNPDEDLLGTGPYVAGEHVSGVSWTFEANPHYWQEGLPLYEEIEVRFIPDDASRLAAIRTGEIDLTMSANPDISTILAGDETVQVTVQPTTDLYYLWMNPQWSGSAVLDERVRQAIALSIDREQVIASALGGIGDLTGIVPAGLPDACPPGGVLGAEGRDVDRAIELLEEAGATGMSMRLTVVPAFGALRAPQMAQVIQQNLKEAGINVEVVTLEGGAWIDEVVTTGEFDATLNWFTGGGTSSHVISYLDPNRTKTFAKIAPTDGDYLAPLGEALALPMGPERTELLAQACEDLNELAFFVPLATKPTIILHRADRVTPVFLPTEPNQMTFRDIAQFAPVK